MFDKILQIIKTKLFKIAPAPISVDFVMNIKYHYHYNCLERFLFEDENHKRYYAGELGSEGYRVWQDAKKGDKIHIVTIDDKPVEVKIVV